MSSVCAPSLTEANSAYLHLSIGVSAEKKGKLQVDAAVTDGKGMCGSE